MDSCESGRGVGYGYGGWGHGLGRGRGRGYKGQDRAEAPKSGGYKGTKTVYKSKLNYEGESKDKERDDMQTNNSGGRGRARWGRGRYGRGRRGVHETRKQFVNSQDTSKEESEDENENSGKRSAVPFKKDCTDEGLFRFLERDDFSPSGSFSDTPIARDGNTSEPSDVSNLSTCTDNTETDSRPDVADDPVRAGVRGIESISIQTLGNRLNRYKRTLNGLKKKENPNFVKIYKLQQEITQINIVFQRRIREEKGSKLIKQNCQEVPESGERNTKYDEYNGAKSKMKQNHTSADTVKTVKQNNSAPKDMYTVNDCGMDMGNMNEEQKKQKPKQTENKQNPKASIENEDHGTICQTNRTRSISTSLKRSMDADPDEIEVFKFIVKEMKGQCSLMDIQTKCSLFKEYQGSLDEWFKRHSRKFAIFKKNASVIEVKAYVKGAEYCLDYIKNGCSKAGCNRYHICRNLLCGFCSFGEKCKFSHDTLDVHNGHISSLLGLNNVFSNEQVKQILSLRFPHVCESWNTDGMCADTTCCKLHICKKHVFGNCLEGNGCPFEHSLTTAQNLMVTDAYHMLKWNPKIFFKLIFVLKRPPACVITSPMDLTATVETFETVEMTKSIGTIRHEETTTRPSLKELQTSLERKESQTINQG